MSLNKSKCLYSYNCLHFLKRAVPFCLPPVGRNWQLISPHYKRSSHRYRKAKIDCLRFVMCPLLAQLEIGFFSSFSAAAVYSTNEANKAGLKQSIIFRCLCLQYTKKQVFSSGQNLKLTGVYFLSLFLAI